ncbi:hypothetical protein DL96DRAFT_1620350 [Flagelloscypha sp. PMI_526]|nr:hypothetical protein DL96DRAFT_1620350 [Flagelloscypha sp. PMI_526]
MTTDTPTTQAIWTSLFTILTDIWFIIIATQQPGVPSLVFHVLVLSFATLGVNFKLFNIAKEKENSSSDSKSVPTLFFARPQTHFRVLLFSGVVWFSMFIVSLFNTILYASELALAIGILATLFTFSTFLTYLLGALSLRRIAVGEKWENGEAGDAVPSQRWSTTTVIAELGGVEKNASVEGSEYSVSSYAQS